MADILNYISDLIKKVQQASSIDVKEEYISELAYLIERSVYIRLENLNEILFSLKAVITSDLEYITKQEVRESYFHCAVSLAEYESFQQHSVDDAFVEKLISLAHFNEELVYVIQIIGMTRNKKYSSILEEYKGSSITQIGEAATEALVELEHKS